MVRSFIAVPLPGDVRALTKRLCNELAPLFDGIKWIEDENLHLTLKFLGDIPQRDVYDVCRALTAVAKRCEPFEMEYRGIGAFPSLEKPRTFWIGVTKGTEPLADMVAQLEDALADLGFRREGRRFTPHLTIGRVRQISPQLSRVTEALRERAEFIGGGAYVDEVIVYSSEMTAQGPIYNAMGTADLGE